MAVFASLALLALVQTDWRPYRLGEFEFSLPSPPKETQVPATPKGIRYWGSLHNGKNAIVISVGELDPKVSAVPDQVFGGAVAGLLDESGGSLQAQSDALLRGWPALDYQVGGNGQTGISRVAVVGDKFVQVLVIGPSAASARGAYDRVVSSVKLPQGRSEGPQTATGPTFARRRLGASPASVEMPREPTTQDRPVNERPNAPIAHIFASAYANRIYLAQFAEIPEDVQEKLEDSDSWRSMLFQQINDEVVDGFKAKAWSSTDTKLDGADALRTVATIGGKATLRVESTIDGGRIYTLVSIVPTIWKDHPEPKGFFESFRLKEQNKGETRVP